MTLTASYLSRRLRTLGFGVVADHNRQGLRVVTSVFTGDPMVAVQIDYRGERERLAADVAESLTLLGYRVERGQGPDAAVLTVRYPKAGE